MNPFDVPYVAAVSNKYLIYEDHDHTLTAIYKAYFSPQNIDMLHRAGYKHMGFEGHELKDQGLINSFAKGEIARQEFLDNLFKNATLKGNNKEEIKTIIADGIEYAKTKGIQVHSLGAEDSKTTNVRDFTAYVAKADPEYVGRLKIVHLKDYVERYLKAYPDSVYGKNVKEILAKMNLPDNALVSFAPNSSYAPEFEKEYNRVFMEERLANDISTADRIKKIAPEGGFAYIVGNAHTLTDGVVLQGGVDNLLEKDGSKVGKIAITNDLNKFAHLALVIGLELPVTAMFVGPDRIVPMQFSVGGKTNMIGQDIKTSELPTEGQVMMTEITDSLIGGLTPPIKAGSSGQEPSKEK